MMSLYLQRMDTYVFLCIQNVNIYHKKKQSGENHITIK